MAESDVEVIDIPSDSESSPGRKMGPNEAPASEYSAKEKNISGSNQQNKKGYLKNFSIAWDAPERVNLAAGVLINVSVNVNATTHSDESKETSGFTSCVEVRHPRPNFKRQKHQQLVPSEIKLTSSVSIPCSMSASDRREPRVLGYQNMKGEVEELIEAITKLRYHMDHLIQIRNKQTRQHMLVTYASAISDLLQKSKHYPLLLKQVKQLEKVNCSLLQLNNEVDDDGQTPTGPKCADINHVVSSLQPTPPLRWGCEMSEFSEQMLSDYYTKAHKAKEKRTEPTKNLPKADVAVPNKRAAKKRSNSTQRTLPQRRGRPAAGAYRVDMDESSGGEQEGGFRKRGRPRKRRSLKTSNYYLSRGSGDDSSSQQITTSHSIDPCADFRIKQESGETSRNSGDHSERRRANQNVVISLDSSDEDNCMQQDSGVVSDSAEGMPVVSVVPEPLFTVQNFDENNLPVIDLRCADQISNISTNGSDSQQCMDTPNPDGQLTHAGKDHSKITELSAKDYVATPHTHENSETPEEFQLTSISSNTDILEHDIHTGLDDSKPPDTKEAYLESVVAEIFSQSHKANT